MKTRTGMLSDSVPFQTISIFFSLYLVAIGQSGHKPCVQAFGADQFDGQDPQESKAKSSFFNWWYLGMCLGPLLVISVLNYIQDNVGWGLGFGIPCIIMTIALVIFLLGSQTYRFLDKALVATSSSDEDGKACCKSEVEEAKTVLRLFPVWATSTGYLNGNSPRDSEVHKRDPSPSMRSTPPTGPSTEEVMKAMVVCMEFMHALGERFPSPLPEPGPAAAHGQRRGVVEHRHIPWP
uniref:Uncharacterized protein n=1 Tax=Chenopodium quinoa TaxID=63459 RepID=A0A803M354_CHEQI